MYRVHSYQIHQITTVPHKNWKRKKVKTKNKRLNLPRAIRPATVNISPIAKGKFDKTAKTLLGNFLTSPQAPPPLFGLALTSSLLSSGAESDNKIFLDMFFPSFLRPWEVLTLQVMVTERDLLLKRVWGWGLKVEWRREDLKRWVLGTKSFGVFDGFNRVSIDGFLEQQFQCFLDRKCVKGIFFLVV